MRDTGRPPILILCNGAKVPSDRENVEWGRKLSLEYRATEAVVQNVKLKLPDFVRNVFHLPDRILDLLEIAAYVYCADRMVKRGEKDAVEYHSWSRSFHFVFKVRDYDFWQYSRVQNTLSEALTFMTGDQSYLFSFKPGHSTPRTSLFDREEFGLSPDGDTSVLLFSGGLDSLAGAVELLNTSKKRLCLVSHRSQPGMARTQDQLVKALHERFPDRIAHYKFYCSLTGVRARDESQRARAFLYTAIAYALSQAVSKTSFSIYENGITALNFPKRQDMINARASRTTHPKTIALLERFFSRVAEEAVSIDTPFFWNTKTDVFSIFDTHGEHFLVPSAVSCSRTRQNLGQATHCGGCSQCIDRLFAAYSAGMDDVDDSGIYAINLFAEGTTDGEIKTTVVDYVRQAFEFATTSLDYFYQSRINELVDVLPWVKPEKSEVEAVQEIYELCHRHGQQVKNGIQRMRELHDHPYRDLPAGSLLQLIGQRQHLRKPVQRLAEDISIRLRQGIPIAFQRELPKNENRLNDEIQALLNTERERFEREHPAIPFALARSIPDHSFNGVRLLVEAKYLRNSTTPSKASEGIAADLTKYPDESFILFVVFDPHRSIPDDITFRRDIEKKRAGMCMVTIIR